MQISEMQISDVTSMPLSRATALSFGRALGCRFPALDRSNRVHRAYHDSN
jgi:hypothetical protein